MPKKSESKKPTRTLTQRRTSGSSSDAGSSLLGTSSTLSSMASSSTGSSSTSPSSSGLSPLDRMSKNTGEEKEGSALKIIIWAIIILAIGVGLALVVRSLTQNSQTDKAEKVVDEQSTTEDTTTTGQTTEENTGTTDTTTTEDTTTTDTTKEDTTTTDTTTEGTTTDTTTTTTLGLTNSYSQKDQTIADGISGNVSITGYSYENSYDNLQYDVKLSGVTKFPNVNATIDTTKKTLTVTVKNISSDGIVGNGSGETVFAGSPNASKVKISHSGTTTTFVFTLGKVTDYKINAVDGTPDLIKVNIKNR